MTYETHWEVEEEVLHVLDMLNPDLSITWFMHLQKVIALQSWDCELHHSTQ